MKSSVGSRLTFIDTHTIYIGGAVRNLYSTVRSMTLWALGPHTSPKFFTPRRGDKKLPKWWKEKDLKRINCTCT
jgi:hypothetical protein